MTPPSFACRFCHSSDVAASHEAREMMFGTRERFEYHECGGCGSLQIADVPEDLARHYPPGYLGVAARPAARLTRWLRRRHFRQLLGFDSLAGRLALRLWGGQAIVEHLARAGVRLDDAVLEVGSGAGELLREMREAGFKDLTGVDPYVGDDDGGAGADVRVLRGTIRDVEGTFDLILFNHSLEHVPDPHEDLRAAAERLSPRGRVLVRLPVAGSHAWRTYGTDWVQLDPPRHLAVPSEEGMCALAERAGFTVGDVVYDSTAFQFWGSEQYRRDVPLTDPRSHFVDPDASIFSEDTLAAWEEHARRLNEEGDGDAACFFLGRR